MKKILSVLLALCLLLSCSVLFTACDELSLKDVVNDPLSALKTAEDNAMGRFFDDDYGVSEIAGEALKKGSTTLSFSSDYLLGEIKDVRAVLYTDLAEKKMATSLAMTVGKDTYSVDSYFDKNGIILDSEALFAESGPIAILYETFADRIADSDFVKAMELDEETVAELKDAIQELKTSFEEKLEEAGEEADKTINEILAILKQSIASDVLDGEDCAVITYTIDNEVIRALVEKLLEVSKVSESEKEAVRNELNLDEMDETVDIDLSFKVYISLADAFLLKESLTGTMTEKGSDAINTVDLTATFGEDTIALVGSITDEGETEAVEVTITKTVKESISTYTLTATSDIGGDVQTVTPLTYTYNQKTRTFKLTLVMDDDEPSLTIKGGVTVKDKEAKIAITEIGTQGVSLELELALTFNADASVPTAPENAKDIVEMTEAQWKQVTAAIERSPLLQILEALFSTPEFDA